MRIRFVDNDGGGLVEDIEVAPGTTPGQLFSLKKGTAADEDRWTTRVNGEPVVGSTLWDRPLKDGDRISISPAKVEAAIV